MELSEFKVQLDKELFAFVQNKIERAQHSAGNSAVKPWIGYPKQLLQKGGKRIRPYVTYEMYCTAGGKPSLHLFQSLLFLELFHLFALTHDDIIDRGEERHGIRSVPAQVFHTLEEQGRLGDSFHTANSQAMLIGDLLFAWSQESFPCTGFPEKGLLHAKEIFNHMVEEVIVGEMIDVDLTTYPRVNQEEILYKTELKTARYTFVQPMRIGVALAEGPKELHRFAADFGVPFGMAFQIQDDLLDLTANASKLEKSVLVDLQASQPTLFTQHIFERGSTTERRQLTQFMGKRLNEAEQKEARLLFEKSGALAYGIEVMNRYFDAAEAAMDRYAPHLSDVIYWQALIQQVRNRKS